MSSTLTVPRFRPLEAIVNSGWKVLVLPGGQMPKRSTMGAAGFDLFTRAIVDAEPSPDRPEMRRALFDFSESFDKSLTGKVQRINGEWVYILAPGEYVRIGIGVIIELPHDQVGYIQPRGSTNNQQIAVKNADVPFDSDFRGEGSSILFNEGQVPYVIRRHSRIVQFVRRPVIVDNPIDVPTIVTSIGHMTRTVRGSGQNGSTGR